jgi:hypothetical protein
MIGLDVQNALIECFRIIQLAAAMQLDRHCLGRLDIQRG